MTVTHTVYANIFRHILVGFTTLLLLISLLISTLSSTFLKKEFFIVV
jgi:hypothetical protein